MTRGRHITVGKGRALLRLGTRMLVLSAIVMSGAAMRLATAQRPDAVASGRSIPSDEITRAAVRLLARPVTLRLQDVTLRQAIDAAAVHAGVRLEYRAEVLSASDKRVTLAVEGMPLETVLHRILSGTALQVIALAGGHLVIGTQGDGATVQVPHPDGGLRGHVVDSASDRGVLGATVVIALRGDSSKTFKSITGRDGAFEIANLAAGLYTISVRAVGYRPYRRSITVEGTDIAQLRIVLAPAANMLSEVVTTAVGDQRRADVPNDVTVLHVDSIMHNAAIATVTDLLDGRVPGLNVTRSSGAPGAASRVRIRGVSSLTGSNDPIIIVDGIRVYSEQTSGRANYDTYYSVLDRLDLNAIDKVEILKGPSASALYGSDAANGVIVVTTKRGQSGPAQWSFTTDQELTTQPRNFPTAYYREGAPLLGGGIGACSLGNFDCIPSGLISFNSFNNKGNTVFGAGYRQSYSLAVSGGASSVTYFLQGSTESTLGLLKMSDNDVAVLARSDGKSIPAWQRRPQRSAFSNVEARTTVKLKPTLTADFQTTIGTTKTQTTPLDGAINVLQNPTSPGDTSVLKTQFGDFRIPDIRRRNQTHEQSLRLSGTATWLPRRWINSQLIAGIDIANRTTTSLLRRGDLIGFGDSTGDATNDDGQRSMGTLAWHSVVNLPALSNILRFTPMVGADYSREYANDNSVFATGLRLGSGTANGAATVTSNQSGGTIKKFGVFLSTDVHLLERFVTTIGTRFDASNVLGAKQQPNYPKIGFSYILSDEPFFPTSVVSLLRLRTSYGHSAVQPDLSAAARTYVQNPYFAVENGIPVSSVVLSSLGNSNLKPERTTEIEGGLDIELYHGRVIGGVTASRKRSVDAIISTPLPPSVGNGSYSSNLGSLQDVGLDANLGVTVVDRNAVTWSVSGTISHLRDRIVSLAPSTNTDFLQGSVSAGSAVFGRRYRVGYPVDGTWMLPAVAYSDANGDGIIESNEIVRSDSSVFVGSPIPNFTSHFNTQVALFSRRVNIAADFDYTNGMSQINQSLIDRVASGIVLLRPIQDGSTPLNEQAAVRSGYAFLHTVSTLRFSSLSVSMTPPKNVLQFFKTTNAQLRISGSNLGLRTNYSGADPNVTSTLLGNSVIDGGVLPMPRTWKASLDLFY